MNHLCYTPHQRRVQRIQVKDRSRYISKRFKTTAYTPGPWINTNMAFYQNRKSHCGDKTVERASYLHNGISFTGKMSLYWIGVLVVIAAATVSAWSGYATYDIIHYIINASIYHAIYPVEVNYFGCLRQLSDWWCLVWNNGRLVVREAGRKTIS